MTEQEATAEAARKRQTEHAEATKKRLAEEKQAREKAHAEQRDTSTAVKPTPTQEENDLAASGVHVIDHEPDGSPPDPGITPTASTKQSRSQAGGPRQLSNPHCDSIGT